MSAWHGLTLALAVGLCGCGSTGTSDGDRSGESAEVQVKSKTNFATHWDALATRLPSFEKSVHVASAFTERTEIGVVRIVDRMQLPFIPANAVPKEFATDLPMLALVVSGKGRVALLSGESWELLPGDALLLPPDARGFLTCTDPRRTGFSSGLRLLTLRVVEPEASFKPQRLAYEDQWKETIEDKEVEIGLLGSAGSLHAYSCGPQPSRENKREGGGLLTPRLQLKREKIVFFVVGQGRFGMASTGNQARPGSLFCIAPNSPYYYENMDPEQGTLALVLYTPPMTKETDDTQAYDPK